MANFLKDNPDLNYYLDKGIDWAPLIELTEGRWGREDGFADSAEALSFYRDVLDAIGEFAAKEVAPRAAEIDEQPMEVVDGEVPHAPALEHIFEAARQLDFHGLCVPRELGGLNCPTLVFSVVTELLARADVSVAAHFGFHGGMAMAMLMYSIYEGTTEIDEQGTIVSTRFQEYIDEILAGRAWGCMDITEPQAGSDMAQLRTKGEQAEDGSWTITGEKIFITSGHGKYHFVIARTEPDEPGDDLTAGLAKMSLFLVPAYEDLPDGSRRRLAHIQRIEEKLGHHGSVTASVTFDKTPAHLIGERGQGFRYMLMMMNSARLGVGFEAIGLCESAYRLARDYARERVSMGKPIARHELIADRLDGMEIDLIGLRALAMEGAWNEEVGRKIEMRLKYDAPVDEAERAAMERRMKRCRRRARFITPLLKYRAGERAVEMCRDALQIHGGYGYMREYGVEKLLRDAMVVPIYEGTSQIQALMAMKDNLQDVIRRPQAFVRRLGQARWRALPAPGRDELERRVAALEAKGLSALQHLVLRTARDKFALVSKRPLVEWTEAFFKNWDPKRDFAYGLLHAERLTDLLADVAIAQALWRQARRHAERRPLLERFLERAEPRCRARLDEITTYGDGLLDRLARERDGGAAREAS